MANRSRRCPPDRADGRPSRARLVEQLLRPGDHWSGTASSGLSDSWGLWGQVAIPQQLNVCLDQTHGLASLRDAMLGVPAVTDNVTGDYDHVRSDRDLMIKVLSGAVRERARGINILLYGPPGSGKTEMTKVVAAAAGLTLYAVSEQSSWAAARPIAPSGWRRWSSPSRS